MGRDLGSTSSHAVCEMGCRRPTPSQVGDIHVSGWTRPSLSSREVYGGLPPALNGLPVRTTPPGPTWHSSAGPGSVTVSSPWLSSPRPVRPVVRAFSPSGVASDPRPVPPPPRRRTPPVAVGHSRTPGTPCTRPGGHRGPAPRGAGGVDPWGVPPSSPPLPSPSAFPASVGHILTSSLPPLSDSSGTRHHVTHPPPELGLDHHCGRVPRVTFSASGRRLPPSPRVRAAPPPPAAVLLSMTVLPLPLSPTGHPPEPWR